MGEPVIGSMNSRWVEVSQAVDEVVMQTQGSVLWGLKMFPTMSGCAARRGGQTGVAGEEGDEDGDAAEAEPWLKRRVNY